MRVIALPALCAWVLWQAVWNTKEGKFHPWERVETYATKESCVVDQRQAEALDQVQREHWAAGGYHGSAPIHSIYKCLPDTVDPRAPKPK